MADYSAEIITRSDSESDLLGLDFGLDLTWWFSAPLPPDFDADEVGFDLLDWFYFGASFEAEEIAVDLFDWRYSPPGTGALLDNGSFELPDGTVEALPAAWSVVAASVLLDVATWIGPWYTTEAFDFGWAGNEDALEAFGSGDLSFAQFGSSGFVFEAFESEWSGNEGWLEELPASAEFATFGAAGDAVEAFEAEWPSRHFVADLDATFPTTPVDDGNTPAILARMNAIKAVHTLHLANLEAHAVADTVNGIDSPDAYDLPSACTLAGELFADGWAHVVDAVPTWHRVDAVQPLRQPDLTLPVTTWAEVADLVNLLGLALLEHYRWGDNGAPWVLEALGDFYPAGADPYAWIEAARFGTGADVVETFEAEWSDNDEALEQLDPGDLVAAGFTIDAGTEAVETFEPALTVQVPTSPGTAGAGLTTGTTNRLRVAFTGSLVGDLGVEAQLAGSPTWVEYGRVTTVPNAIDFDSGFKAVRVYCHGYTSGSPAASVRWRPLDE